MGKCAAVARKEVFYVWPFGLGAWAAGVVFIDRTHRQRANNQLDEASELITNQKVTVEIRKDKFAKSLFKLNLPILFFDVVLLFVCQSMTQSKVFCFDFNNNICT